MKWVEECNWKQGNVVELFKETAKNSMADQLLWRSEEFGGKEKKLKKLIKELKDTKQKYDHYENGHKIKMLEKRIGNLLKYIGSKGPELTGCWRETERQIFFMPRLQQEKEKKKFESV